jgi:murein DD-endopeptidase MepM/ murein hydrolase activator NlpD
MGCNCQAPNKDSLWTPLPEYINPTLDIQLGENIDCYMARATSQTGLKNDIGAKIDSKIDNTSLTSDLNLNVNTTFILTPNSTRTATSWAINVDGSGSVSPLTELTFNTGTGLLSGTVTEPHANKSYNVLITTSDGDGVIDSRAFTFFPKKAGKDDTIKFVIPLAGNSHVTCGYGPRTPPTPRASAMHKGYDYAMVDHSRGDIVSTADGTVVKTGPATGFGNWIIIEHPDSQGNIVASSVYGHMNDGDTYVTVGQKVSAGQKIAKEGNNGIGTAPHLHFEIHKGKWSQKNAVDPGPYLHGAVSVATNNNPAVQIDSGPAPTGFKTQTNTNVGMTTAESQSGIPCPTTVPGDESLPPVVIPPVISPGTPSPEQPPKPPTNNINSYRSACAPPAGSTPSTAAVVAAIQKACVEAGFPIGGQDATFIQTVATIESGLDPYAKCPTTSATGLYQMVNKTAVAVYGAAGIPPTCENRCDAYLSTKAFIAWYKSDFLPYWQSFVASGKTKIKNLTIKQTAWSAQYTNLTQSEFMYGLIHHDGIGNAVNGLDQGGVKYWRTRVGTA